MRALVIGFGSIGRRHARLLEELGMDVAVVSRRDVDAPKSYRCIADAVADWPPGYAMMASRTHEHRSDFAARAGKDEALCTLEQGLEVLSMIETAETAAVDKMWIAA